MRGEPLHMVAQAPLDLGNVLLTVLEQVLSSVTMGNSSSEIRGHPHSASSPSKRVFSMPLPRKAPLNTPGTPVLEDLPQNDDERERLQRRRSRAFDLQLSTDSPHLLASPSSR